MVADYEVFSDVSSKPSLFSSHECFSHGLLNRLFNLLMTSSSHLFCNVLIE